MSLNKWARQPGRFVTKMQGGAASSWPATLRGQGTPAALTTNVAQTAALNARVDRQEAMFEAVLERFSSLGPPTSREAETLQALGGGPGLESAPVPVM